MTSDATHEGFTRGPNWTYDLMPVTTPAQYKVISAAVRLTYGWNQEWTEASAQAVADLTGIARPNVTKILNLFAAVGLIDRAPGQRNSYRWRLVPMMPAHLSSLITAHLSSEITSDDATCNQRLQQPVTSGYTHLSSEITTHIRSKDRVLKTGKTEREQDAPAVRAPQATAQETRQSNGEPDQPEQPIRPVRNPNPPVPPAPPSPAPAGELAQSRLVETADVDPVAVYREATKVTKPNEAQRKAIRERVTGHTGIWREVCERFARNGWNVRALDNLLDAYDKAVAELKRAEAARAREAEERRAREMPRLTPEEREANLRRLAEARAQLAARAASQGLFAAAEGPRRPPWRPGQP